MNNARLDTNKVKMKTQVVLVLLLATYFEIIVGYFKVDKKL